MKKKLIFAIATGFFAIATVFNMNMVQGNDAGDVSLESIIVMQQAQAEYTAPSDKTVVSQSLFYCKIQKKTDCGGSGSGC